MKKQIIKLTFLITFCNIGLVLQAQMYNEFGLNLGGGINFNYGQFVEAEGDFYLTQATFFPTIGFSARLALKNDKSFFTGLNVQGNNFIYGIKDFDLEGVKADYEAKINFASFKIPLIYQLNWKTKKENTLQLGFGLNASYNISVLRREKITVPFFVSDTSQVPQYEWFVPFPDSTRAAQYFSIEPTIHLGLEFKDDRGHTNSIQFYYEAGIMKAPQYRFYGYVSDNTGNRNDFSMKVTPIISALGFRYIYYF